MARFSQYLLALLPLVAHVKAASYSLSDNFVGPSFLTEFAVLNIADPTHGRVNYVDAATARSQNLTYASGDTFILRSDSSTVLSPSGPGRNSVRLQSNKQFGTSVMIQYPPHATRLRGVNDQGPNHATLHTSSGCVMPAQREQTGTSLQLDCDVAVNGNAGCGVQLPQANSYGPPFNANGGGWYAVERTDSFIKVWFWARNDAAVPADVRNSATSVNTDSWGTPVAFFPTTASCSIAEKFGPHNIIINLTFCGDWAGQDAIFSNAGCPGTCVDYVNNNPAAFAEAYFDFASAKVYQ
ncbi:hypothetical protein VNI00_006604 [Paramarasmius palmivorus]|uniref:Glycoside hydrolase family 16 protein n=1 Tax=Paramarasmius palmivorus TaxID=297713 RepID=A0AAW0D512_9AGAR